MAAKKKTLAASAEELAEKITDNVVKGAKELKKAAEETAEEAVDVVKGALSEEKKKSKKKPEKNGKAEASAEEKKAKLAKLLEKAKKLESAVEEVSDIDLRRKVKPEEEEKKDTLVPMENYLKSSIHLGTRVITPDMRTYVYRRRADGLAVFNTALLDDKMREGAAFLAQFAPDRILVVCKREAGWKAVKRFAAATGITAFTKKYPAGILTNTTLENFREADLIVICDPWLDKNALLDANRIRILVLSICDTNNFTKGITQVIPGNNKSAKSLGMIFYLLTKLYIEARKLPMQTPPIQEFVDDWDILQPPK